MDWINKQLSRLTYAEGNQSVALGALIGFMVALVLAAINGVSAGWLVVAAFAGSIPGAFVMTIFSACWHLPLAVKQADLGSRHGFNI